MSKFPTTQHGTYARYASGCRCPLCTEYQRSRVARSRKARVESGSLNHGTRSAYDCGCRCDQCKDARRDAYKRLRSERPRREAS